MQERKRGKSLTLPKACSTLLLFAELSTTLSNRLVKQNKTHVFTIFTHSVSTGSWHAKRALCLAVFCKIAGVEMLQLLRPNLLHGNLANTWSTD